MAAAGDGLYLGRRRFGRLTLQVHGGIYLLLALAFSGALAQAGNSCWAAHVDGSQPASESWRALLLPRCATRWRCAECARRAPGTSAPCACAAAVPLVWLAAGISAGALTAAYHGLFGAGATHAYCATLRTAVLALWRCCWPGRARAGRSWNCRA